MPCSVKLCKYTNFAVLSNADQHLEGGWWFDLLVKSKICVSCTRLLFLAQQWIKVVIMLGPSRPTNASNVMKKSRHRWRIPILLLNQYHYRAGRWLTCLLYQHSYCLVLHKQNIMSTNNALQWNRSQNTRYRAEEVQVPFLYWYSHYLEWLYRTLLDTLQWNRILYRTLLETLQWNRILQTCPAILMLLLFRLSFQAQYKQEQCNYSWDSEMHIYVEFIWQIYKIDVHV